MSQSRISVPEWTALLHWMWQQSLWLTLFDRFEIRAEVEAELQGILSGAQGIALRAVLAFGRHCSGAAVWAKAFGIPLHVDLNAAYGQDPSGEHMWQFVSDVNVLFGCQGLGPGRFHQELTFQLGPGRCRRRCKINQGK